jgi:hypothetical protein
MIQIAITFVVLGLIEWKWSPRLEYVKESSVLLFFFTEKNIRKCLVLWKF